MLYENRINSYAVSISEHSLQYPSHVHSYIETIHVAEGQLEMQIGSQIYILGKDDFAIIFPNVIHNYHSLTDDSHTTLDIGNVVIYQLSLNRINIEKNLPNTPVIRSTDAPEQLYWIQDQLNLLVGSTDKELIARSLFSLFLAYAYPYLHLRPVDESINKEEALRIIAYVSEHSLEDITLDIIARKFGMSRYGVSRIFSNMLGVSLPQYLNQQRINYATYQLMNTNTDMLNIAYNCGYHKQQTFNRVFKEIMGMTPSEYRKQNIGRIYPENQEPLLPRRN